ncbi:TatD family hydrolase [Parabacteroides bouchesdurhonensis]|uniref:TatD family hydrolase n=1 Tax=Parabacteroides bouchesdurhonensis TaxID=1936995 RepID=UPI000C823E6D|nr:TatD family hydrolase [Parabacteroides bouchesdurhonensis]
MKYYDIHTHQPSVHPEDIAVINFDPIRMKSEFLSEENQISLERNLFSCGIHPWYIENAEIQLKELKSLLFLPEIVAVGEAGFDKLVQTSLSAQQDIFFAQARLAEDCAKPLIIHCVKAWQEIIAAKKRIRPHVPWIIHGFRGNGELAVQLVNQGFYLSFGEYFNVEALQAVWPGRLLVETDDKQIDIRLVYTKLAEALSVDMELFTHQIEENIIGVGIK